MNVDAIFQGGPADGLELALIGSEPSYLLVMENPVSDSPMRWLICGADFDDHWPGQLRYEKAGLKAGPDDVFGLDCILYRYAP